MPPKARSQSAPARTRAVDAHSQHCDALLAIGRDTASCETYEGKTGRGHGHAEMDALHRFVGASKTELAEAAEKKGKRVPPGQRLNEEMARKLNGAGLKTVRCGKEICLKCGKVLQDLGFTLVPPTRWGTNTMGSTEWGVSLDVADFLKAAIGEARLLEIKDDPLSREQAAGLRCRAQSATDRAGAGKRSGHKRVRRDDEGE